MPLRYINRTQSRRALAGYYQAARAGLVTPLRDGLNLVAEEFVAAQDPDDPGVLVLSRFAGAAFLLERALIVNPYDVYGVGAASTGRWPCRWTSARSGTRSSWRRSGATTSRLGAAAASPRWTPSRTPERRQVPSRGRAALAGGYQQGDPVHNPRQTHRIRCVMTNFVSCSLRESAFHLQVKHPEFHGQTFRARQYVAKHSRTGAEGSHHKRLVGRPPSPQRDDLCAHHPLPVGSSCQRLGLEIRDLALHTSSVAFIASRSCLRVVAMPRLRLEIPLGLSRPSARPNASVRPGGSSVTVRPTRPRRGAPPCSSA